MRTHGLFLGILVAAGASPLACGGPTQPTYGPPDGIVGKQPPQATGTATGTPAPTGDSGSAMTDSGAEGGMSACSVSWTKDVFPLLESTGSAACGTTLCHASGGQQATVIDGNASGTYANFKSYTGVNGKPYVAAGDTNAADSMIDCNLVTSTCGAAAMPIAPTGSLSAAQKTTIDTWVKCGAPAN